MRAPYGGVARKKVSGRGFTWGRGQSESVANAVGCEVGVADIDVIFSPRQQWSLYCAVQCRLSWMGWRLGCTTSESEVIAMQSDWSLHTVDVLN